MTVKIYVGNVPPKALNSELKELFEKFGKVVECDILKEFAFVHMEEVSDAKAAIAGLNDTLWKGNRIRVEISTTKVNKGEQPLRDRGGGDRRDDRRRSLDNNRRRGNGDRAPSQMDRDRSRFKDRARDEREGAQPFRGGGGRGRGGGGGRGMREMRGGRDDRFQGNKFGDDGQSNGGGPMRNNSRFSSRGGFSGGRGRPYQNDRGAPRFSREGPPQQGSSIPMPARGPPMQMQQRQPGPGFNYGMPPQHHQPPPPPQSQGPSPQFRSGPYHPGGGNFPPAPNFADSYNRPPMHQAPPIHQIPDFYRGPPMPPQMPPRYSIKY